MLLLAPSVTAFQQLVLAWEGGLHRLFMPIDVKKSASVRIVPHFSINGQTSTLMALRLAGVIVSDI